MFIVTSESLSEIHIYMPRQETILQLFLASPGDVVEEREIVEKVVNEFNITWRREIGKSIEIVRWESHSVPGVGADPQELINEQIGSEYDIFVGIMWTKFGSPTLRAESGTQEEFKLAKARCDKGSKAPRILMYFKNEGIDLDKLDLEQYQKVSNFQKSMGEEGLFYWSFKQVEEFESYIRIHLSRVVQGWNSEDGGSSEPIAQRNLIKSGPRDEFDVEDDEENSFLDLILGGLEDFNESTNSLDSISKAIEEIGVAMDIRTQEIQDIGEANDSKSLKDVKRVSNAAA